MLALVVFTSKAEAIQGGAGTASTTGLIRFAFYGDTQAELNCNVARATRWDPFMVPSLSYVNTQCTPSVTVPDPFAFLLQLGDFRENRPSNVSATCFTDEQHRMDEFAQAVQPCPFFPVAGNHDSDTGANFSSSLNTFSSRFGATTFSPIKEYLVSSDAGVSFTGCAPADDPYVGHGGNYIVEKTFRGERLVVIALEKNTAHCQDMYDTWLHPALDAMVLADAHFHAVVESHHILDGNHLTSANGDRGQVIFEQTIELYTQIFGLFGGHIGGCQNGFYGNFANRRRIGLLTNPQGGSGEGRIDWATIDPVADTIEFEAIEPHDLGAACAAGALNTAVAGAIDLGWHGGLANDSPVLEDLSATGFTVTAIPAAGDVDTTELWDRDWDDVVTQTWGGGLPACMGDGTVTLDPHSQTFPYAKTFGLDFDASTACRTPNTYAATTLTVNDGVNPAVVETFLLTVLNPVPQTQTHAFIAEWQTWGIINGDQPVAYDFDTLDMVSNPEDPQTLVTDPGGVFGGPWDGCVAFANDATGAFTTNINCSNGTYSTELDLDGTVGDNVAINARFVVKTGPNTKPVCTDPGDKTWTVAQLPETIALAGTDADGDELHYWVSSPDSCITYTDGGFDDNTGQIDVVACGVGTYLLTVLCGDPYTQAPNELPGNIDAELAYQITVTINP